MKIQKRNSKRKHGIILMAAMFLCVVLLCVGYLFMHSSKDVPVRPVNTVDYNSATEAQKSDGLDAKRKTLENNNEKSNAVPNVTITLARQMAKGQPLSVRTYIDGVSAGQCVFTFTKDGQSSFSRAFTVTQDVSSMVCNGDIAVSDFEVSGNWMLMATLLDPSGKTLSKTNNITITVE